MILIPRKQGKDRYMAYHLLTLCLVLSQLGRGEIAAAETEEASGEVGQLSAMQSPIHAPAQPKSKSSKRILFIERN